MIYKHKTILALIYMNVKLQGEKKEHALKPSEKSSRKYLVLRGMNQAILDTL
jgi:hypothetical protein